MKGQIGGFSSAQMSPELDRHGDIDDKYTKAKRRWEMVLDRKHHNTDLKGKHMKEQLAKKFKREKEMALKAKENEFYRDEMI